VRQHERASPDAAPSSSPAWDRELPAGARSLELGVNRGFAGAINAALRHEDAHDAEYVALVNDDVVLEAGWLAPLVGALDAAPGLGSVQGVNLAFPGASGAEPDRIDGVGLAWNRWWQAVQLLHGRPAAEAPRRQTEVFGVAATAALYRREALLASALPGNDGRADILDERLFAYYEDVDLACRLRGAGFAAAVAPASRAHHRGSATGLLAPRRRLAWIYGNRWLVVARLLGRRMPLAVPRMLLRDAADLLRAVTRGSLREQAGIALGLLRALRLLPRYLRGGPPLIVPRVLALQSAESWEQALPKVACGRPGHGEIRA
jgi:GT2 family glycosyltransferase